MPGKRLRINPDSLNFEEVKRGTGYWISRVLAVTFVIGVCCALSIIIYSSAVKNPKVLKLENEVSFLETQLANFNADLDTLQLIAGDLQKRDDEIYRNIFGAEPYPEHLRRGGIGGADRYKDLRGYEHSNQLAETKKRLASLQRQVVAQSKSLDEVHEMAKRKTEMLSSIPAIQPVNNDDLTRMASGFGYRIHPIYKIRKLHTGMDFTAPVGTEIYATGDGKIMRVEKKRSGYGYNVMIQHGYGYQTLYAHMSKILVKEGQEVTRGEVIGLVGNTGTSVGPHCHYEVVKDGSKVNPANYFFNDLTPEQYEELLEKAQTSNQSLD